MFKLKLNVLTCENWLLIVNLEKLLLQSRLQKKAFIDAILRLINEAVHYVQGVPVWLDGNVYY